MWNLLPELITDRFEEGGILVSNTGTIYIPVLAHLGTLLRKFRKVEKRVRNPCGAVVYVVSMQRDC